MTDTRTVAFVDLAGFTALTEAHGDEAAVDLLDVFTATAADATFGTGAKVVKSIGDAVMLVADQAEAALAAVGRLFEAVYETDAFPEPRAGLHHGPVVSKDGDFFGATVNLAARVAARAGSGQALVTTGVARVAEAGGLDVIALGPAVMRNVLDPVELFAVEICPAHVDLSVDPVCRMRLSCQAAVARVRHADREHWLCSLECLRAFAAQPDRYLTLKGAPPL